MDSMILNSLIVNGFIKPFILILVILLLWFCVRKKSAALQHFVLSLGLVSVLLLPLLAGILPIIDVVHFPNLVRVIQTPQAWLNALMSQLVSSIDATSLILIAGLYLLPATWLLFYLALGVYGLNRMVSRAEVVEDEVILAQVNELRELLDISRSVRVVVSAEINSPQTWGLWRPVIMLPREALMWTEEKQLSVFVHELGHIARWDWLTTLAIKITCACFWFLVPVWYLAQLIYQQAEIACDDYIYKLHDKHIAYAQSLLAIASEDGKNHADNDALYMRGSSPIYSRIMSVLDQQRSHRPVPVEAAQYWLIIGGLFVSLFACVQLIPMQSPISERVVRALRLEFSSHNPAVVDAHAIKVEQFSWDLLQQLKPRIESSPAAIKNIEQVAIHVARPTKQEMQALDSVIGEHKQSLAIPAIQIQGYLPLVMATPEYPALALERGVEGWVEVKFSIDVNGEIIEPQINAHSPSGIFDRSVLKALKKSRYQPQLLDGQPVVVQGVTELFRFNLVADAKRSGSDKSLGASLSDDELIDHRRR